MIESFQIRPLSEFDLDSAFQTAGGSRAHPDADSRQNLGADYKLGGSLIELKGLDEEGFSKPPRQAKLAKLFKEYEPHRPVIVIDRRILQPADKVQFDRIIEGPIKTAVTKANRQLKQSRREQPSAKCSVLMVVNNGYTTLDHDALKSLVTHRVRQDTSNINAVVVAGAYYHSDGFDGIFLWPIDCVPINLAHPFSEFEQLRVGWNTLAQDFMTRLIRGELGCDLTKGPVVDTQFDWDGTTYVRPAPILGTESQFYIHGRPRKDSSGLTSCPPVGLTFPALSRAEWQRLKDLAIDSSEMKNTLELWKELEVLGQMEGRALCPFVTIPITAKEWGLWCEDRGDTGSVFDFANERFCKRVQDLALAARDLNLVRIIPSRYVLVVTDIIGQDQANDISHIAIIKERVGRESHRREVVENVRITHKHAIALAAAYAVRGGVDSVMYLNNTEYAWV